MQPIQGERRVVYRKGVKHCFSLVMYRFCSSNALYTENLSKIFQLLFQIKSQLGVAYKSVNYKKAFNVVFQSSKNEEITVPDEFIFVFIMYFIGAILSEKSCRKQRVQKKYEKGGMAIQGGEGGVYQKGVRTSCTLTGVALAP